MFSLSLFVRFTSSLSYPFSYLSVRSIAFILFSFLFFITQFSVNIDFCLPRFCQFCDAGWSCHNTFPVHFVSSPLLSYVVSVVTAACYLLYLSVPVRETFGLVSIVKMYCEVFLIKNNHFIAIMSVY